LFNAAILSINSYAKIYRNDTSTNFIVYHCSLPHRQLRNVVRISEDPTQGSLPHRQLRNWSLHHIGEGTRSLPHRQLRKNILIASFLVISSLPHRQLRNIQGHVVLVAPLFTAAQAA